MVFSSLTFLFAFLPIVVLAYYIVPVKAKNIILLIASLVFYAWGEPVYVLLMLYEIVLNYIFGIFLDRAQKHRKYILIFAIIMDLGILFFFKYYGFFVENINRIPGVSIKAHTLALPIGISFYTFQTLSYMVDLYRGKFKAQRNIMDFALYISMFPQLIAGPIVRYESVYQALKERKHSFELFGKGSVRFIIGLSKKVLLANNVGALFDAVNASGGSAAATAWMGAIAYTFQIYFDFSGYSDMAIGLGNIFGFSFDENFNHPYIAKNVTDFWRRWHISLSTWFREYVYIPLGGNRVGRAKHIRNILIVWFLTGMWHGAKWTFIVWGMYYGILLLVDKYLIGAKIKNYLWPVTMVIVIIGWVIFSADSLGLAWNTITVMFGRTGCFWNGESSNLIGTYGVVLAACVLFCVPLPKTFKDRIMSLKAGPIVAFVGVVFISILSLVYLVSQSYNPFLYFQF